jgi:hypothetical protein
MHSEQPELIKDQYWDERVQFELPYTAASQPYKITDQHVGSAANMMSVSNYFIYGSWLK